MQLQYDHFATTKTDDHEEVSKVWGRAYWSCHKVSDRSQNHIDRKQSFRLAATDLITQRFYWSLRGRQVDLISSQTGFRLYADQFRVEKGGDSLQTWSDLSVTDWQWGGDQMALQQRLVADWLQNGFQVCADHMAMVLQYVSDLSAH